MRRGIRIGIDVGRARIGVARSDPDGLLATPVETVARDPEGDADVRRILELAGEAEALELVVGHPLNLRGEATPATDDAVAFARRLDAAGPIPVRLVDERLSTVSAAGQLRAAGRTSRTSRAAIDQASAVVILQHAIDSERAAGRPAGRPISQEETDDGR